MQEKLQGWANQRGYRVAWGSKAVVENARHDIAARHAGSEIEKAFFEDALLPVMADEVDNSKQTVVVIAKPSPAHSVCFRLEERSFDALLPPTYFRYRASFDEVRADLAENGLPGAQVDHLMGPLKAIAGRLGHVRYSCNNISYEKEFGSYMQLYGFWTDAKLPKMQPDGGVEPSLLPQCENCSICWSVCPTDAIREDRVLLRAERCLTFINENAGDWPEWLNSTGHHCLLGCLECQRACPANPDLPIEHTGLVFSDDETHSLISTDHPPEEAVAAGIRSKLEWLGQPAIEPFLSRNLKALLKNQ